jgi:hypothetical protein
LARNARRDESNSSRELAIFETIVVAAERCAPAFFGSVDR